MRGALRLKRAEVGDVEGQHLHAFAQILAFTHRGVEVAQVLVRAVMDVAPGGQALAERHVLLGLQDPGVPDLVDLARHRDGAGALVRDEQEAQGLLDLHGQLIGTEVGKFAPQIVQHRCV